MAQIRKKWPARARSLFEEIPVFAGTRSWRGVNAQGIDYVFGLAKNPRLLKEIDAELKEAEAESAKTGEMARIFKNFRYQTLEQRGAERGV